MSKPVSRVVFSVLISLAIALAIFTSVQGGLSSKVLKTEANRAQAHVVNGLMTNLNHDRRSASELESMAAQAELYSQNSGRGHGGGCEDELRFDPND